MTYRDDGDAWLSKRAQLVKGIAGEEDLAMRERRVDELAALDRTRRIEARRKLPMLAGARIASPCHEPFEAMTGEGAIRSCARCDREVFDVARMTLAEAEALVTSRSCVRLTKRADGTMMFADCEVGARGIRAQRVGALVAGVVLASAAATIAIVHPHFHLPHIAPRHAAPRHPIAPASSAEPPAVIEMGQMRALPESATPFSLADRPLTRRVRSTMSERCDVSSTARTATRVI